MYAGSYLYYAYFINVHEDFLKWHISRLLNKDICFKHVFAWLSYLVLNCANPFLSLFGLKCRDLEKMTCHGFDRFLSVEDEDLVSPHRFEDNTQSVLLCLLVVFKLCTGLVPNFVL